MPLETCDAIAQGYRNAHFTPLCVFFMNVMCNQADGYPSGVTANGEPFKSRERGFRSPQRVSLHQLHLGITFGSHDCRSYALDLFFIFDRKHEYKGFIQREKIAFCIANMFALVLWFV